MILAVSIAHLPALILKPDYSNLTLCAMRHALGEFSVKKSVYFMFQFTLH